MAKATPSNIPAFMRMRDQWLVWEHSAENKKMPLQLSSVRRFIDSRETGAAKPQPVYYGSANDAANITHYPDASMLASYLNDAKRMKADIGYAMTGDDRLIILDFDKVLDAHGKFTDEKVASVVRDLHTYVEVSPSGRGVHCYVAISVALKKKLLEHIRSWCSFRARLEDGSQHSVFVGAGFVTVTNKPLEGFSQPFNMKADPFITKWFELRFPGSKQGHATAEPADDDVDLEDGGVAQQVTDALQNIDPDCDRDTWVRVGMILHKITQGDERGMRVWDNWSKRAPHRYPTRREQSTEKLYRSFNATTTRGVSLGTLLHLAKAAGGDSKDAVREARERLQRTIHIAQDSLHALAQARGVSIQATTQSAEGLDIVSMSNLPNEATRWLWTYMVPFGHLILVSGGVSSGKSTFLLKLTADVSQGRPLGYDRERKTYLERLTREFGADNPLAKPYKTSGVVYYLTSEMHWTQTAVPTLRRCGAKEKNVFFMRKTVIKDKKGVEKSRPFDLVTDLDRLIKHIIASKVIPDMIILDPITSFMGTQVDRNAEADVRSILEMMADFCASIGIAFIGVLHQNKSLDHSGVGKLLGSIAFGAVARLVLFVWPCDAPNGGEGEKEDWEKGSKHFGVTVEKSNIGPTDTAHIFKSAPGDRVGMQVDYVEDKPIRDFLRDMLKSRDEKAAPKREQVQTFINSQCIEADKAFGTKAEAQTYVAQNTGCSVTYAQQIINEFFAWKTDAEGAMKLHRRTVN